MIIGRSDENPTGAAAHVVDRLVTFSRRQPGYMVNPQGLGIEIYRKLVSALVLLLPAYVAVSSVFLLRRQWPWLTALVACRIDAVDRVAGDAGEQGEEARFLFTILPMLLAVAGFALDDLTEIFVPGSAVFPATKAHPLRLVLRTNCKLSDVP